MMHVDQNQNQKANKNKNWLLVVHLLFSHFWLVTLFHIPPSKIWKDLLTDILGNINALDIRPPNKQPHSLQMAAHKQRACAYLCSSHGHSCTKNSSNAVGTVEVSTGFGSHDNMLSVPSLKPLSLSSHWPFSPSVKLLDTAISAHCFHFLSSHSSVSPFHNSFCHHYSPKSVASTVPMISQLLILTGIFQTYLLFNHLILLTTLKKNKLYPQF